jgi:hypothetical protein
MATDRAKFGAAVVGGYLLGRTKKGGAALRLASWLSGNTAGPKMVGMARQGVTTVLASDQAKEITEQLRGPVMDAIRQAAMDAAMARVNRISDNLVARTQALGTVGGVTDAASTATKKVSETTKDAAGGVSGAVSSLTGKLKPKKDKKDKAEQDEPDEPDDEQDDQQEPPSEESGGFRGAGEAGGGEGRGGSCLKSPPSSPG